MPTTEPNVPVPPSIKSIIANNSSNEAKILALERRMAGVDPGRSLSMGSSTLLSTFAHLPGGPASQAMGNVAGNSTGAQRGPPAACGQAQFAAHVENGVSSRTTTAPAAAGDSASKRRRTDGTPEFGSIPSSLPGSMSPSSSRPPLLDITPATGFQLRDRQALTDPALAAAFTGSSPAVHAAPRAVAGDADMVPPSPESVLPPGPGGIQTPTPGLRPQPSSNQAADASTADAAPGSQGPDASGTTPVANVQQRPLPWTQHQHQQQVTPPASGTATAAPPAVGPGGLTGGSDGGGGSKVRARKRKQRDPKHEANTSLAVTRTAQGTTPPAGGGVTPGATANGAAAATGIPGAGCCTAPPAMSSPRQNRGSAGPPKDRAVGGGGGVSSNPQGTPPRLARHLFEEPGPGAAAAGGGGRSSNSAAGGPGGRAAAAVAATAPPSAQKRNILSYYAPVLGSAADAAAGGGGGGGGAIGSSGPHGPGAGTGALVMDQNSRDSLPPSLQQHPRQQQLQPQRQQLSLLQQQQQYRRGTVSGPGGAWVDRGNGEGSGGEGGAVASAHQAQLHQCQQQVTALQAQVMQVQSAMAAQQAAAGAEIDKLRRDLEARCLEAAALQDKARSQEAALKKAISAEAAARAGLESLQAASAAEAARWSAEAAEAARVAAEREGHYRGELARLVQSSARLERDLARGQLSANAARLGSLTLVRTGPMQMAEVWEDGTAFQQLATRRAAVAAAKEEVVAAQKLLRKRLAPPPSGARSAAATAAVPSSSSGAVALAGAGEESTLGVAQDVSYMTGLEFVAADEVYKTRLAVLKREEESLRDEEERLNREKFKQIRAVKLAREEDGSRFGRWPVLQDRPGPEGRPRYVLMNLLGKGGFSEVFKAYDLVEARPVCVKIHALASNWPSAKKESYVRHAIREYDIHRSLRHPAVVALLDVLEIDLDTFATVLELCEGGDLDTLLREHRTLPEKEARCLMAQIFSGLRYLAARRVIHYDLKPANILFDSLGQAKITDFGLSKQVTEGQTLAGIELTSQGAGTYWYLPPEAFETGGPTPPRISNKLDVWSAGVIFYSMLYGKKPYGEAMSQEQMLRERVMAVPREVEFPSRPAVSAEAKDFIRRCLAWQQERRPDVEAAATDPYLTGSTAAPAGAAGSGAAAGSGGSGGGVATSLGGGLAGAVLGAGRR